MSSAEPVRRRFFQRLDLIYFVLAGIDLLTICTALYVNHVTTTAFEAGVTVSAEWSARQADIVRLSHLAQTVDAPGNDVFYTRDPSGEHAKFESAKIAFDAEWRRIAADIERETLSPHDGDIRGSLTNIQQIMSQMSVESEVILHEFAAGREGRASRGMAVMDRTFASLMSELDGALAIVEAGRAEHLSEQLRRARSMRQLEIGIGVAVLLIVGLVATYGVHMGGVIRANELQRATMLNEVAAARDRLQHYADDVSHELRGPISKMRLDSEVLLQVDRTAAQYRAGVESILIECQRLSTIVESLLFLARAENTTVSINRAPLDASRELTLLREFFAPAAEQAGVALSVVAGKSVVWADRSLLQRAVSNLVSNALAHTGSDGAIVLSAVAGAGETIISVQDNGSGISPDLLPRAFDRFQRGGEKKGGDGLGLGLAITKSIMELHGGSIELVSRETGGVEARLRFPSSAAA